MAFSDLPRFAAWHHRDAREGFEAVFLRSSGDGFRLEGHTVAVEDEEAWAVEYAISVDAGWVTRGATVIGRSAAGRREVAIESDGAGRWRIDGERAAHLDGCLDVDLESSSATNALPVHRLDLAVGERAEAPAAYVRALDLSVERLEQRYLRLDDEVLRQRYDYSAPRFEFRAQLVYDESGLVIDYPGIAVRAA
jgi:uncharacterized protein